MELERVKGSSSFQTTYGGTSMVACEGIGKTKVFGQDSGLSIPSSPRTRFSYAFHILFLYKNLIK